MIRLVLQQQRHSLRAYCERGRPLIFHHSHVSQQQQQQQRRPLSQAAAPARRKRKPVQPAKHIKMVEAKHLAWLTKQQQQLPAVPRASAMPPLPTVGPTGRVLWTVATSNQRDQLLASRGLTPASTLMKHLQQIETALHLPRAQIDVHEVMGAGAADSTRFLTVRTISIPKQALPFYNNNTIMAANTDSNSDDSIVVLVNCGLAATKSDSKRYAIKDFLWQLENELQFSLTNLPSLPSLEPQQPPQHVVPNKESTVKIPPNDKHTVDGPNDRAIWTAATSKERGQFFSDRGITDWTRIVFSISSVLNLPPAQLVMKTDEKNRFLAIRTISIPKHVLPLYDVPAVSDGNKYFTDNDNSDSIVLVNSGLGASKKESKRFAVMDFMWQLANEFQLDLVHLLNLKKKPPHVAPNKESTIKTPPHPLKKKIPPSPLPKVGPTGRAIWTKQTFDERKHFFLSLGINKSTLADHRQRIDNFLYLSPPQIDVQHVTGDAVAGYSRHDYHITVRTTKVPKAVFSLTKNIKPFKNSSKGSAVAPIQTTINGDNNSSNNNDDDSFIVLVNSGLAASKKDSNNYAIMDFMWQLANDFQLDLLHLPNLHQLQMEAATAELRNKARHAKQLLDLVTDERHRRPFIETSSARQSPMQLYETPSYSFSYHKPQSKADKMVADLNVRLRNGRRLIITGSPAESKVDAVNRVLVKAVADNGPLPDLLGRHSYQHYQRLLHHLSQKSSTPHVARLCLPPLPERAIDILNAALGPDRAERWQEIQRQVQESEAAWQVKRLAFYKKQMQLEYHRLEALKSGEHQQSPEWKRMQAALAREEGERLAATRGSPMETIRQGLPIFAIRDELLSALKDHSVVVVSGGTGSGKSTQCPQYILEDAIAQNRGPDTKIIVTQPRRIAAISVAERVSEERREPSLGRSVGYSVRHNTIAPRPRGSIEFVTTGVLLRRMQMDRTVTGISHIMIDEVHERDINTDFLLILLKELITKRPDLRVIIMSATLDAESLAKYFATGLATSAEHQPVPCLSVPAKPRFPVDVVYIEDIAGETQSESSSDEAYPQHLANMAESLLNMQDQQLRHELNSRKEDFVLEKDISDPDDDSDLMQSTTQSSAEDSLSKPLKTQNELRFAKLTEAAEMRGISRNDNGAPRTMRFNPNDITRALFQTMANLALHVAKEEIDQGRKGSILCFLPGWDEIKLTLNILEEIAEDLLPKLTLIALHSSVPKEEQHRIFDPAKEGTMKIILATNIAESSVTINDALAIIDAGLVREMNWNAESEMSTMLTLPTSRASATQRLGRAGRVAPGRCYRLYSRGFHHAMPERPSPEIQRAGLENTCLQACGMTSDGVQRFLSRAMDPPPEDTVEYSLENLKRLGAIKETSSGEALTNVGRLLSRLPLDPSIAKMLMLGCVLQCLDPVLTAAACLSGNDPFYRPLDSRDEARAKRTSFCGKSDIMSIVKAYNTYMEKQKRRGDWDETRQWASENYLSPAAISRISTLRSQLVQELQRIDFIDENDVQCFSPKKRTVMEYSVLNRHSSNEPLFVGVWATGVPRNLAARNHMGNFGTMVTRTESGAGLHPSSVAFHRKPPIIPTELPDWFFYSEMVHSSDVYLRNVTAATPEQVLLFGGFNLNRLEHDDIDPSNSAVYFHAPVSAHTILDDWIIADSSCRKSLDLLHDARQEIEAALTSKVMNPRSQVDEKTQEVIDAIAKSLRIVNGIVVDEEPQEEEIAWW